MGLFIIVLFSCLGMAGGLIYFWAMNNAILSSWKELDPVPEKAVEIVSGDINSVYVRSVSDNIYGCKHGQKRVTPGCWFPAQDPFDVEAETEYDNPLYEGSLNPPGNQVIDELVATVWYADAAFETRYALDENGIVWKWEYEKGWVDMLVCVLGLAAGATVGLLVVILWWFFVWISRIVRAKEA